MTKVWNRSIHCRQHQKFWNCKIDAVIRGM